jgi:hypothetical protein
MNCANHPEIAATAFCRECGKPMCADCQRPALGSVYCAEHLPAAASPFVAPPVVPRAEQAIPGASPYTAPVTPAWTGPTRQVVDPGAHPALALLLGFVPGVGAIYNGQYAKGLIHAIVFGLLVSVVSETHNGGVAALVGIMIGVWVIYQAFEAFHTARKRRYGVAVEEFSSLFEFRPSNGRFPFGAIILIGLGFFLLLDTTDIISINQLVRYWPGILIVFGFYMLYNRLGSADHRRGPAQPADTSEGGARR